MRVPNSGQPLYERRIVREGKRIAEQMLAGYSVTANGTFVLDASRPQPLIALAMESLGRFYQRAANSLR